MVIHIKQWGNSLGFRIPKGIADLLDLKAEDPLEVTFSKNGFTVKKRNLKDLLSRVTSENKHDTIDFDGPEGEEKL